MAAGVRATAVGQFQAKTDDLHFVAMIGHALAEIRRWDEPELNEIILLAIVSGRRRGEE